MNRHLFCSALLSLSFYGMSNGSAPADVSANESSDANALTNTQVASDQDDLKMVAETRQVNSLMEAFMAGKLHAKEVEMKENEGTHPQAKQIKKLVAYNDYADPSKAYEEPLEKAHKMLTQINTMVRYKAMGDESMPVQVTVRRLQRDACIEYLRGLSEIDKSQFQMLRLDDFLLPVRSQDSSKIGKKRLALIQALKASDVKAINAVCSKPSDLGEFVSLDQSIQKMVVAVEKGQKGQDALIAPRTSCVIS